MQCRPPMPLAVLTAASLITIATVFRGRRGDILKELRFDGQELLLLVKRLERGRLVWPQSVKRQVSLIPAQLSMLLEGIDWRMPMRPDQPRARGLSHDHARNLRRLPAQSRTVYPRA